MSNVTCSYRGLHAVAALAALSALSACQPTVQVGLVSTPAIPYTTPPFRPYDVIANGYETCPTSGADDPLPGRYPPCPAESAVRQPRFAAIR